ncbi:hypothetical protein K9F62_15205 [Desulfovibrio sp. JY]|nr:hypothetical protein K9F62_15205 [Desulfovibrio sp. JY]
MAMMVSLVSVEGCNAGGSGSVTGVSRLKTKQLSLQINPAALVAIILLYSRIILPVLSSVLLGGVFFKENQNDRKLSHVTPRRAVAFGPPIAQPRRKVA